MNGWNQAEAEILMWIQQHVRNTFFNPIMIGASWLNNAGMLSIVTVLFLLLWKKYRIVGVTAAVSLISECCIVNLILKPFIARTRPFVEELDLKLLGSLPGDASFPSGHTGAAFAVAIVLYLCLPKKAGIPALLVAAAIAFSRLYNGAHYPTDVVAAILVALFTAIISWKIIYFRIKKTKTDDI